MVKKEGGSVLGSWAFLIGTVLAILTVFFPIDTNAWIPVALVIIGLVVGLLNITAKEAMGFLTAGAVLVIVTFMGGEVFADVGIVWLQNIVNALMFVFVPATIIVALRAVFALAHK